MADIRPFPAYRPTADKAHEVASPPYDVLNSDEAKEMAGSNPYSFLHVVKAEIDLPADEAKDNPKVYAKSDENLQRLIEDGVLVQDQKPAFYVYRLTMPTTTGDHTQFGLAVGCAVQEYVDGKIKKHEFTRRDKEDDRAAHMEVLGVNAGPVLFTYRAHDEVRALINRFIDGKAPHTEFVADDGIGHAVWVVDGERDIADLQQVFAGIDAIYVADGHHRTASAHRVRDILRDKNPNHTGDEAYNHFLAVLFSDDELKLMGYHRVVADLNGLSSEDYLAKVGEIFEMTEIPSGNTPEPADHQQFGMFLDGKWYNLKARAGSFPADDPVQSLDAAILQNLLLAPVLGIGDPRTDKRIDFVGGSRGSRELERRCKTDMKVAFAFAPAAVSQIMAVADAGEVMPPKSTWFEPKLRSGLLVRSLKD